MSRYLHIAMSGTRAGPLGEHRRAGALGVAGGAARTAGERGRARGGALILGDLY